MLSSFRIRVIILVIICFFFKRYIVVNSTLFRK
nr:MAG TPA: hypothetical protein [Caudoviricetes sp.]